MKHKQERAADPFESPLKLKTKTPFTNIQFGAVSMFEPVNILRKQMNDDLFSLANSLPAPLHSEAKEILSGYSGGDRDFFRLFYTPAWSFLYWVCEAADCNSLSIESLSLARRAHAMSLFIHLWDDHLNDGQLDPDVPRLQIRTEAWNTFTVSARSISSRIGIDPVVIDDFCAKYLRSVHRPAAVRDLEAYGRQFVKQIAIWTVVPYLLGWAFGGSETAQQLCRLIEQFGIAWRYLDDIQDIHMDVTEDKKTAVWLELDEQGRLLWEQCRKASTAESRFDSATWRALADYVHTSGALVRLQHRIAERLKEAEQIAVKNGWNGISTEIQQSLMPLQ